MHSKIDVIFDGVAGVKDRDFNKHNVDLSTVDFEKAISLTGFGKFHYSIVIISGLIFASAGFQNGLNAYVMPSAQYDLSMSSSEKGLLNAVFLTGALASSFFWGILADCIGRKKVLVYSLIIDGIITLISSISQTFAVFAIFRFLNGFVIGAPGSIIMPYLGEFLGNNHRPSCLCAVGFFWTISWMILPAAALAIIPISWSYEVEGFVFNSWRIYVAMFSLPSLICGIVLALYFPESPKFLFSQNKEIETLHILKYMYRKTYGDRQGEYPVKTILSEEKEGPNANIILSNTQSHLPANRSSKPSLYIIAKKIWGQATSLFSYPVIHSTILASTLTFTNMFGYYGLGLWLPELFNRFEEHYKYSNESVTVCEVISKAKNYSDFEWAYMNDTNFTFPDENSYPNSEINPVVFLNTFITGSACLVANILASILAKKVGLKLLTIVTMLISGISAIGIYFLRTATENLVVSCIFLALVGTGNTVINSCVVDLFPTKIRALAVCTAIFTGRLGAVASNLTLGYVLDISCEVPIFLMGSVLLVSLGICRVLNLVITTVIIGERSWGKIPYKRLPERAGSFLGLLLPNSSGESKTNKRPNV